jgi:Cep192 domain 4
MIVPFPRGLAAAVFLFVLFGSAAPGGQRSNGFAGGQHGKRAGAGTAVSSGTGTGTGASASASVPSSTLEFGSVVVGTSNSQTITLSNPGVDLTIISVAISGAGFGVSGISTPLTLDTGQSVSFTATFDPASATTVSGDISMESSTATYTIGLSGTGVAAVLQISPSTSSVSFGNVAMGTSSSQPVTLTNTGNADVNISSVTASGTGFASSGGSGVILAPNQSVTATVSFDPSAAGAVTGRLSISSNATNSPTIQLSGAGVSAPTGHSVALSWSPSASTVIGYFVYRGTISGGPYAKLNSPVDPALSYTDDSVASGQTYYYVVTSVDSSNVESAYSNQLGVTIPTP